MKAALLAMHYQNDVLHPDGKRLFVANEDDNQVSVISIPERRTISEIEVGVEPEGMGVSPDGHIVVNTSETTSMLHVIDAERLEVVDNLLVDTRPRVAQVSADNRHIWVSSELRGTVEIFDAQTREPLAKIMFEVPSVSPELVQAVGIQLTRDGTRAYVALGPANRVVEVDAKSYKVLRTHLVGQRLDRRT